MALGHTMAYTTSGAYSMSQGNFNGSHKCVCCDRQLGLPNGDRQLCDSCDEDIPDHIPPEQYITYMKELWRKR